MVAVLQPRVSLVLPYLQVVAGDPQAVVAALTEVHCDDFPCFHGDLTKDMHGGQDNEDSGCEHYSEYHSRRSCLLDSMPYNLCSFRNFGVFNFRWLACDSIPELLQGDGLEANEKAFVVDDFLPQIIDDEISRIAKQSPIWVVISAS